MSILGLTAEILCDATLIARGRLYWYDVILFALAAVVVYPDKVIEWLNGNTTWSLERLHVVLLFLVAAACFAAAVVLLQAKYPRLDWWRALSFLAVVGVFRVASWFVDSTILR